MSKVKIVLNEKGVRELLQSDEAMAICKEIADAALDELGSGYEVTTVKGKRRAIVSIQAVTRSAKRDNAKHNRILKAIKRT